MSSASDLPTKPPATCVSMWLGGNLGPVSAACLASFVRHGHRVVLYCYDAPNDVPPGVELADAAAIVSSTRIVRHKETGSYALFANLFRYELQRRDLGIWIDCDLYCVRPFSFDQEYLFGWQSRNEVNNAVLRLPGASKLVGELIGLFGKPTPVFPWLGDSDQRQFRERKLSGEKFDLSDLPWGSAGPRALTYLVREMGLVRHALPPAVFYPLPARDAPQLLRADTGLTRFLTPATRAVHLWNEALRYHLSKAERRSPIDRLLCQGTLFDESPVREVGGREKVDGRPR